MTALGSHEHFRCDQCRTTIRVKVEDLHRGTSIIPTSKAFDVTAEEREHPLRPRDWLALRIFGGSRLENVKHLCRDCLNSLDRHIFGPQACDGPKVRQLEELLKRARSALEGVDLGDGPHEYIRSDIDAYFYPPETVTIEGPKP